MGNNYIEFTNFIVKTLKLQSKNGFDIKKRTIKYSKNIKITDRVKMGLTLKKGPLNIVKTLKLQTE